MVEELIEGTLAFMEQHGFETLANTAAPACPTSTTHHHLVETRQRRRPFRPQSSPTRTPSGARATCGRDRHHPNEQRDPPPRAPSGRREESIPSPTSSEDAVWPSDPHDAALPTKSMDARPEAIGSVDSTARPVRCHWEEEAHADYCDEVLAGLRPRGRHRWMSRAGPSPSLTRTACSMCMSPMRRHGLRLRSLGRCGSR